jgi:hypothetical protein
MLMNRLEAEKTTRRGYRMYPRNWILVASVVSVVLLAPFVPTPGDKAGRQGLFDVARNSAYLSSALHLYIMDKGRFPETLADYCAAPYLVVPCASLKNPFTRSALAGNDAAGEFYTTVLPSGAMMVRVRFGNDRLHLHEWQYKEPVVAWREAVDGSRLPGDTDEVKRFRTLSPPSKQAYAVGYTVARAIKWAVSFNRQTLNTPPLVAVPPSLAAFRDLSEKLANEWLDKGTVFKKRGPGYLLGSMAVDWDKLVNAFSEATARETPTPTPGGFRYAFDPSNSCGLVQAFGNDGQVVFETQVEPEFDYCRPTSKP